MTNLIGNRSRSRSLFFLSLAFSLFFRVPMPSSAAEPATAPLVTVRDIPLPGNATRLDYADIDPHNRHLTIAQLGDSALLVIDLDHRLILREIPGIPAIHGVIESSRTGKIFATATGVDKLFEIDSRTMSILRTYPSGHHPDGLAFDPENNRVFISDETGDAVTVIDVKARKVLRAIPLPGEVGNTRYNRVKNQVFVTVSGPKKDEVVEIDPVSLRIVRTLPVETGCKPHGERLSLNGSEIDLLCQKSAKLLILDTGTGKVKEQFRVGVDPDVLAIDRKRGHLVVASESGAVSVFARIRDTWKKMGQQYVSYRAHTVVIDPKTGLVYLPLQDVHGRPVLRIMKIRSIPKSQKNKAE